MKTGTIQLPVSARDLIPHQSPVRLIRRLLEFDGETAVLESILPSQCRLFNTGLPNVAILELMAQAYAAMKGYLDITNNRPIGRGYLVGVRRFDMLAHAEIIDRLRVKVKSSGSFNDFYLAETSVSAEGIPVATSSLKLWIPSND